MAYTGAFAAIPRREVTGSSLSEVSVAEDVEGGGQMTAAKSSGIASVLQGTRPLVVRFHRTRNETGQEDNNRR